ncbi:MBL fold metallo-hydrolase [Alicyclobacillus acidoterrestris]|uniref:MBL fold metallo-hydrolase n=1 Tax=Alicyclobacillus acidoterrestris (strain ATCC 49025 / DSM 3922 / CIP 106132 / NCIMB 13137 / GD3B) TaxID=1356854 RepID=T0CIT7_ALIAG|nr:MBL fold metallo-hydrolase [Alicyclobacillus acidoterrestris]EPZ52724.1 hypothetical protein N007_19845 [Alicyclobacillus acidoterrestris ATCC 49025]UNO47618.1 MBL fold metallo-hydrolase [Alicyclobacillus acidoterrestris]
MTGNLHTETLCEHVLRVELPTHTLEPLASTNVYVIHQKDAAIVVDCGGADGADIEQLADCLRQLGIQRVTGYIATHYHADHTGGIPALQARFPGPVYVHPLDHAGAAKAMHCSPNDLLAPPDTLSLGHLDIRVEHKPGHTHGHLHLFIRQHRLLLVGDHMAGSGTVWIGPPDGHMNDYYQALEHIEKSQAILALPGHGPVIPSPQAASRQLRLHRLAREREIYNWLANGKKTADQLVDLIYAHRNLGNAKHVAKRTIQAHLARLVELGEVDCQALAPDFQMMYFIRKSQEGNYT